MTTKTVNRIYSDLDLSFAMHPITGDVARKFDVNAVKQALKVLVLTNFYERPFQPKIGSPIYGMMFENVDIVTANSLKLRLEQLISKYEPRVRSQQIDVVPLFDQNAFNVTIYFYVVGVADPVSFSTVLRRSR